MSAHGRGFRLESGGLVDRSKPLRFQFNGRPMQGFAGDTLASALLANGVRVVGRSFKYHRPRGLQGVGLEDPNSMVAVHDGYGHDPAIRAGQLLLADGLQARSVSGWPTSTFDIGAAAQLISPFIKAGFYYKTFMWPGWKWYEPMIRRCTGYGRPEMRTARRRRETRYHTCDVLIVGGGAAGIAAARGLLGSSLRVILADDQPALGGVLRWSHATVEDRPAASWSAYQQAALAGSDNVQLLPNTVVTGAYEGNLFTLLQNRHEIGDAETLGGVAMERMWQVRARHVVLATGSIDRPMVFAGNDRPGIMLAGAVERFLGEFAVAPADRLAVFTNNDAGYRTALAARAAGLEVAAIVDTRNAPTAAPQAELDAAGIRRFTGAGIIATYGYKGLRAVDVAPLAGGRTDRISCSALAVSGGVTPLIHLAAQRGSKPSYDPLAGAFVCRRLPPGWYGIGDVAGPCDMRQALEEGASVAEALRSGGTAAPARRRATPADVSAFWRPEANKSSEMFLDLQNDVTVADIEIAASEGYVSVEHLKRYTTLGMGTDQGRTSNINGLAVMAMLTGQQIGELGTTTFRPPYTGVRMGTIAHIRQKGLYRPKRLMPAHDAHVAAGAEMMDFGWHRPDWYRGNGPDREAAVTMEMAAVRSDVGIFDASPLGKIEVAGPDARTFLNRFYVSDLATLRPGRIRYSVMLKEDGTVFDDGVVTCVDETLFIAGPSSAQADFVASWFERWRQTEWPNLQVAVSPATSNWACFAIAGPKARSLLGDLGLGIDASAATFPHMTFGETTVGGMPVRISRVSFTGELQYEIAVPARFGRSLFAHLVKVGRSHGARSVGMEAWLRLRLEKGYLHVGTDTNGRTTPRDIGMAEIVDNKSTDFIGKRSLSLAYNASGEREELVGLRAVQGALAAGGRVLAMVDSRPPCPSHGYVTSACFSAAVGSHIGLGMVLRGRSRMGERVMIYDDGGLVEAEICPPRFYDPENERLRA